MNSSHWANRLVVFSKPPQPGRVKTRLASRLGFEGAARLHHAFLSDTLASVADLDCEVVLAWGVDAGEELPSTWPGRQRDQRGGDLGDRLAAVMSEEADDGAAVVVLGSDHPDFDPAAVADAFTRLRTGSAEVVLGPTSDGGYWLVGCAPGVDVRSLFADTPWSSDRVFATTSCRARALGLRVATVAAAEDVDTPADLERLLTRLQGLSPDRCPATRATLRQLAEGVA